MPNEQRLDQLREDAWQKGFVAGSGANVTGGPIPRRIGYYGEPVVRPPVWTWEIATYFFVGGLGGMSPVIAIFATLFHHIDVARTAMMLAVGAALISPILLILDLGRPARFLNMLRVFKPQSAMSMGAWILVLFSSCALPALIALEIHSRGFFSGPIDSVMRLAAGVLLAASAVLGTLLATYTGVLLGATAIPAWFSHHALLPVHFGTVGLGSCAALLELLGYRIAPLNAIGFAAAAIETLVAISLVIKRQGAADAALHRARSGWLLRIAEIFTGPLPLILRIFGLIPIAAVSFAAGALVSRFGWISAGRASGSDPEAVFAAQGS